MKKQLIAKLATPTMGRNASNPDTPMVGAGSLIASEGGELTEVITVRTFYASRGSGMQPVRACVWIHSLKGSGQDWRSGRGSAGGCGYHKESQAIAEALSNCGVRLFGNPYSRDPADLKREFHFGGTGSSAYAEIFKEVARAVGFRGRMVWVSHGL